MTEEEIKDEYNKCIQSFEYFKNKYIEFKRNEKTIYHIKETFNKNLEHYLEIYKEDREKQIISNVITNIVQNEIR